jgi:hypothetical protein
MTKFKVKEVFTLENKNMFVLVGDVVEGEVSIGMVAIPNSDEKEKYKILGVEFADKLSEKISNIGLLLPLDEIRKNEKENKGLWEGKVIECN